MMTSAAAWSAILANDSVLRTMVKRAALGASNADHEDIASLVMIECHTRLMRDYDPAKGMSVSTYIGMVARSRSLDAMRGRKFATAFDGGADDGTGEDDSAPISNEIASSDDDGFAALDRKEVRARLLAAISTLSPDRQAFAEDAFAEEMPIPELATKYGISQGTCYTRKNRIIADLADTME